MSRDPAADVGRSTVFTVGEKREPASTGGAQWQPLTSLGL